MNCFEEHTLAPEVHVWLEAEDQSSLRQRPEPFVPHDRMGRNAHQRDTIERVVVDESPSGHALFMKREVVAGSEQSIFDGLSVQLPIVPDTGPDPMCRHDEFGHVPLRVELDADLLAINGFLSPGVVMRCKAEQTAGR